MIASAAPTTTLIRLEVRDSQTGRAVVPDLLQIDGRDMNDLFDAAGRGDLVVAPGRHTIRVRANGYHEMNTHQSPEPGQQITNVLLLDPLTPPQALTAALNCCSEPGSARLSGYVVDEATGQGVSGTTVTIAAADASATTDIEGFYSWDLQRMAEPEHRIHDVVFTKAGYQLSVLRNVLIESASQNVVNVRLAPGSGTRVEDHSARRGRMQATQLDGQPPLDESAGGEAPKVSASSIPQPLTLQAAPTSIRVGHNCNTSTTCTTVETVSMETYVKHVLPAEWFSSWTSNSLKAGAIAIRSYGGYYVYHPIVPASYDICDTTSCQVYGSGTASSTNTAVDATAGLYVVDASGNIGRAEYSAENNDSGSCADCFTINNPNDAICLSDSVCCGFPTNGHGRGMCQWGTQRWSQQGQVYTWIVDHYYSAYGWTQADLTAPPVIMQQPASQEVCAGTIVMFQVVATGGGTLTYQWQKNNVNLTNTGHYSGVTTDTLTVSSIDGADVGSYHCIVSNGGSVTSSDASLTLKQLVAADFDQDCDVDDQDVQLFLPCLTGANQPIAGGCALKNIDGDTDIDASDFGLLQRCLSGPGVTPDLNCAD